MTQLPNFSKHIYNTPCWIKKGRIEISISSYALSSRFGQDWLPDWEIFESDLVAMFFEENQRNMAIFHSGEIHHGAKMVAQLAQLAGAFYSSSRGKQVHFDGASFSKNFSRNYDELSKFRERGYYRGFSLGDRIFSPELVLRGEINKKDLISRR